jgi:hypothetical protein
VTSWLKDETNVSSLFRILQKTKRVMLLLLVVKMFFIQIKTGTSGHYAEKKYTVA